MISRLSRYIRHPFVEEGEHTCPHLYTYQLYPPNHTSNMTISYLGKLPLSILPHSPTPASSISRRAAPFPGKTKLTK